MVTQDPTFGQTIWCQYLNSIQQQIQVIYGKENSTQHFNSILIKISEIIQIYSSHELNLAIIQNKKYQNLFPFMQSYVQLKKDA